MKTSQTRLLLRAISALTLCLTLAQFAAPPGTHAVEQAALSRSTSLSYPNSPLDPPGPVDGSTATTTFTVLPGDFVTGARVSKVTIDIAFSKSSDTCPGPGGDDDWAEEIRFRLFAPDGTSVILVNYDYLYSNPDVGPVTVTFDDDAAVPVTGLPIQNGTFLPSVGTLADFDGLDPTGVWTLELSDVWAGDPLCFSSATLHVTVANPADLSVEKTEGADPATAGEDLFYTLTARNAGPGTATSVVMTDTLPLDVTYVDDSAGCTLSAGTGPGGADQLVCPLGDLSPGASRSVQIQTALPPDALVGDADGTRIITNTAHISSATNDVYLSNNTVTEATFIQDRADLRVTKLSQPDTTVQAGDLFTYTILVDNLGPSHARDVTLSDAILSSGDFDLVSLTDDPGRPDSCTPTAGGFDGSLSAPLEPGGRWTVQIVLRANEAQDVSNLVEVTSATPDPFLDNNQAVDFVSVTAVADVSVSKPSIAPVTAGTTATFTVTVTNAGPSAAANVVLVDALPVGMQPLLPLDPTLNCYVTVPVLGGATITCNLGHLAAGDSRTLVYTAAVDPGVADGTLLVNSASASTTTFDAGNTNNAAAAETLVLSTAALSVVKASEPASVIAGEMFEYHVTVGNGGPSTAHDVLLLDTLPPQVVALSASVTRGANGTPAGSGGTCDILPASSQVICQLGDVLVGEDVAIVLTARALPGAVPPDDADDTLVVANDVTASASNAPTASTGAATSITRVSDLSVSKIGDPALVYAGGLLRYTLTVANAGPSDAAGVVVTDTLPAAVAYDLDTGSCQRVATAPDVLRCELGTLPVGERRQIDIFTHVLPDAVPGQDVANQVTVAGSAADPNPANDTATAVSRVRGLADLRVTMFGRADGSVRAGERLTYTIVVDNLGPGYAHGVLLESAIQSSGTFEMLASSSDRAATCTPAPGSFAGSLALRCELADPLEVVTPSTSGRWTVTVVVRAAEAQAIANVATVMSSDEDPESTNNQAIAQHEITDVANLSVAKAALGQTQVDGQPAGVFTSTIDAVTAGGRLTYTLLVHNDGPSTAQNVVVQDRLPAWVAILNVATSQGRCNVGTPGDPAAPQTCNLGALSPGHSAGVTVTVGLPTWVPSGTVLYNEAWVLSDTFDPDNTDDFDTNLTATSAWADLALTKVQSPTLALPGQEIVYTVVVENLGPSNAQVAHVSDVLPSGIDGATWTCVAAGGAACTAGGSGSIEESLYDFPAAGRVVYTLVGTLDASHAITNTATVAPVAGCADPWTDNNAGYTVNAPRSIFLPIIMNGLGQPGPDLVVASLDVTANAIQIVIENRGSAPVVDAFWVDVYIDPSPPPRTVNQSWPDLADQGLVWGIPSSVLPLETGEQISLTFGDTYYWPDLSLVTWPLAPGTAVYAQVDSYNPSTAYGQVEESHEISGGVYNNIAGPVLSP